jgi:hypothetical protein
LNFSDASGQNPDYNNWAVCLNLCLKLFARVGEIGIGFMAGMCTLLAMHNASVGNYPMALANMSAGSFLYGLALIGLNGVSAPPVICLLIGGAIAAISMIDHF